MRLLVPLSIISFFSSMFNGFPSIPNISRWCSEPSSHGSVRMLLLNSKSCLRKVHMPSSGGSSDSWLFDASNSRSWRSSPKAAGSEVSLLEAM